MSRRIFAIFFILIFVCSCVETVVVGTVAGGVIITKENNNEETSETVSNNDAVDSEREIKKIIKKALKDDDSSAYRNIDIIVSNGRILLTGYVRDVKYKKSAITVVSASQPNNEIINEIIVLEPDEKISGISDYFISQSVSFRLKKVKDIVLSDYKYNITNSVAVIIGKAQNRGQADDITKTISTTRGITKVISYIQF